MEDQVPVSPEEKLIKKTWTATEAQIFRVGQLYANGMLDVAVLKPVSPVTLEELQMGKLNKPSKPDKASVRFTIEEGDVFGVPIRFIQGRIGDTKVVLKMLD